MYFYFTKQIPCTPVNPSNARFVPVYQRISCTSVYIYMCVRVCVVVVCVCVCGGCVCGGVVYGVVVVLCVCVCGVVVCVFVCVCVFVKCWFPLKMSKPVFRLIRNFGYL